MSYDTTQSDLEDLFSGVGEVTEVIVPADRATGRPRGFAFVKFANDEAIAMAVEKFDGHELHGRAIRVSQAEEQQPRSHGFFDAGGGPPNANRAPRPSKPKGSRRNIRAKKRGGF